MSRIERWLHRLAAERRWRARNRLERQKPCPCGRPATSFVASPYGQVGRVAPIFALCDEHASVPLTACWSRQPDGAFLPEPLVDADGH